MAQLLPFQPPQASTIAQSVDRVFFIELAISVAVIVMVAGMLLTFCIAYRRRHEEQSPPRQPTHYGLELTWTAATFLLFSFCFFLGVKVYVRAKHVPANAAQVYVVGKQWMWKIQHSDGVREINTLHVPTGQPTELVMTSEDVIHDFFVPAFRVKQDVLPGSYTSLWFTATVPGTYHLFCAQYCGTDHATMVGSVVVLTPADYEAWRAGVGSSFSAADAGRTLMTTYGCVQCHGQTAPSFAGLYMSQVRLSDGTTVTADDNYLRQSIIHPNAQLVAGYPPIMPSFQGQLSAEQVNSLVQYIKMLSVAKAPASPPKNEAPLLHQLPNLPPAQGRPDVTPAPMEAPTP